MKTKKYTVTVKEIYSIDIEVEANSENEAREIASGILLEEELESNYVSTFDIDDWYVEQKH